MLESVRKHARSAAGDGCSGVDHPADLAPLAFEVDSAIADIQAMAEPRDAEAVWDRLSRLIEKADHFAAEDRDEAYRYVVKIWCAAGFARDSGLFRSPR